MSLFANSFATANAITIAITSGKNCAMSSEITIASTSLQVQ